MTKSVARFVSVDRFQIVGKAIEVVSREFNRSKVSGILAVAVLMSALATLVLFAAPASADLTVCPPGESAGQCSDPSGVASDTETKRLYVADRGNNRINVFEADEGEGKVEFLFAFGWGVDTGAPAFETCTSASGCQAGLAGSGNGQFSGPRRVAVDNDLGSPAHHCLYVYESSNLRVQKFCPVGEAVAFAKKSESPIEFHDGSNQIAVGSGGVLYVGDIINFEEKALIKRLNANLEPSGECELPHKDRLSEGLAVDSAGYIYASFNKGGGIFKFEADCDAIASPYPLTSNLLSTALAVDGADNLYAMEGVSGVGSQAFRPVTKFSPAGTLLRRYGYGSLLNTTIPGVAPLAGALGDIFAGEQSGAVKYLSEPEPGPVVASLAVDEGNVRATLEAEINPEGKAGTKYRFEYVDDASFKTEGGFGGPNTKATEEVTLPGAGDFELHLASALAGCEVATKELIEEGKCLIPETLYHYLVQTSNADGSGNSPVVGTFKAEPPLAIEDTFASEVGTDSARLSAKVNPLTIPTTGFFEYVDQRAFEASGFAEAIQFPNVDEGAGPLSFGSGSAGTTRSVSVSLAPSTTYRVRVKATDPLLEEEAVPGFGKAVTGKEVVFTTLKPEEAEPCPENEAFRGGQSALLPDCRAYEMVSPLDKEGGDIYSLGGIARALTQSSLTGDRFVYGSYRAFGDAQAGPLTSQYLAARDPSGWHSHYILGPRERLTTTILGGLATELRGLSPDLCQAWIRTVAEPPLAPKAVAGQRNLYRRADEECGVRSWETLTTASPPHGDFGFLEMQGTSADGSKAIYLAGNNLTKDAPDLGGEESALYYQSENEGPPRYVCYLPGGTPIASSCAAGTTFDGISGRNRSASLTGAISADGERVFWSTPADFSGGTGKIYMREHPSQGQSAISASKCTQPAKACTIAVSTKGEELSKTTSSQFWWAAKDGSRVLYSTGGTLYEFEVASETTRAIVGKALGVLGASEDAGRIYLASEEVLSGANAQGHSPVAGKANLYLEAGGSFRFVTTLLAEDVNFTRESTPVNRLPAQRNSRVSGDGLHAAFASAASLTGYDNTDAKSGQDDTEVFLYDATANGGQGKLICTSCNPSGARPAGRQLQVGPTTKLWAAALLPTWKTSLYPGRMMAEDGSRLYFEAQDALVPRDSNGAADVYQWEASGAGSCDVADAAYSAQNEGCVSLISTGQSAGDAAFLDTSPSGNDVFFTTGSSLVPQDYGLVDVYDARVNGGLPSPAPPAPECEGEACQAPAEAPNDPTPASASVRGAGNVVQPRIRKQRKKAHKKKRRAKRHSRVNHGGRR